MSLITVEQLYEQHIKPRPTGEQLRLVALITRQLADLSTTEAPEPPSLLELEGLGAEIWAGIDAQEYVHELREEWDHRP